MANNFWTDAKYQPMQQFRYDVQAMLYKGDFSGTLEDTIPSLVGKILANRVSIDKELIKAVNMPDVSVGYDNDAANIGSGGPSIESQDPQIAELELQLYMTPQLAQDIQDIFRAYYLQDVIDDGSGGFIGTPARILNKDRVSLIPSPLLIQNSQIIVNIYDPNPKPVKDFPATPAKSIRYYGVYPVSYNLGSLDYSSSDVVMGSMKFYFYGADIRSDDDANRSTQEETGILASIFAKNNKCMGNF